jgi:hypothetical protein
MKALSFFLALTSIAFLAPGRAQAQAISYDSEGRPQDFSSPQRWAIELRFGPYYPNVDAEFKGGDPPVPPHQKYFGTSKRLMTQLEVDYQFFRRFGTLAAALQVGYFSETANSFELGSDSKRSADETTLTLFPTALSLVYRFDVAARRWGIPVVPYGKAGLSYTMWRVTDSNGDTAKSQMPAGTGRGGTLGWQAAAGLSLMLDFLDPGSARELDSGSGVNHTYLFFELAHFAVDGFGSTGVLNVGDTTWLAGLMFEF